MWFPRHLDASTNGGFTVIARASKVGASVDLVTRLERRSGRRRDDGPCDIITGDDLLVGVIREQGTWEKERPLQFSGAEGYCLDLDQMVISYRIRYWDTLRAVNVKGLGSEIENERFSSGRIL